MSDTKGKAKGGLASNTLTNSQTQYTNFLFGENLEERVLLPAKEEAPNDTKKEETENGEENGEHSVAQKLPEKRKYEVITGEEDESNVLQIFCKLYLWDSTSAFWKEKGKGMLRLNDKKKDEKICSRLVMRTAGSLKVILNASIVPGMKFELSNENCLRFINIDGIYLFKGKEKEIEQLNSAIESRLRELSKKVKVDENDDTTEETVKEPLEDTNSKALEDSTKKSKEELKEEEEEEELEKPDNEGSQLKKKLEKNEDLDEENSRKENVPEGENKTTVEQNDDHEEKEEEKQHQNKSKTETNKTNHKEEETAASPSSPDLDQK